MKKQKLRSLIMLCLLFLLGVVYCAHVFVAENKTAVQSVMSDNSEDNAESSEENLKETSQHLFLLEKIRYQLKPVTANILNLNGPVLAALPDAYLQLNTPPPNFA